MDEPRLFPDEATPHTRRRFVSKDQPSWVATWGTQIGLVCAPDEATVRERVRAGTHAALADDEIMVRPATRADASLVEEITSKSERTQLALGDWTRGIQRHEGAPE